MTKKKPTGRPPFAWTREIEDEILTRIMRGESVATICATTRDDWLPSEVTFYKHLSSDDGFAQRYARAREAQAHREFDEIRQIAENAQPETVAVAKLQIDARKWRAGKLAPKVYGDKLDMNVSNPDGSLKPTVIQLVAGPARDDG
ncbi:hypothetical protein PE067_16170 [Paracoccus sp. DMF-8]|uniref:terminase small subunit-like protein n=1 Tax=Paracoccus sp. DMF-8 TaxID=3019445 RepID=UPI0023E3F4DC|nr:hypothetical protein [Paracoccus sp. DMF-8]MDF3607544.1 hypothetical protein [Paracoccus sp. DMF-8]